MGERSETEIKDKIYKYFTGIGAYVIKMTGSAYLPAGIPDLIICWKGKYVAIEVKRPGEKASRIQVHDLVSIDKAGGIAMVLDFFDPEFLRRIFEETL